MAEANFDPSVHTIGARIEQLDLIFDRHPEAFLVGSVARAAIAGYDASVSKGRIAGVRDIDVCSANGDSIQLSINENTPFPADVALRGLIKLNENGTEATVLFDRRRPDVSVRLPGAVFEPYPIVVDGVPRRTFHPDTMLNLQRIVNVGRPKDAKNIAKFQAQLEKVKYTRLPESVFDPLDYLQVMVSNDPALNKRRQVEHLQSLYCHYVPRQVRKIIKPVATPMKRKFILGSREAPFETPSGLSSSPPSGQILV